MASEQGEYGLIPDVRRATVNRNGNVTDTVSGCLRNLCGIRVPSTTGLGLAARSFFSVYRARSPVFRLQIRFNSSTADEGRAQRAGHDTNEAVQGLRDELRRRLSLALLSALPSCDLTPAAGRLHVETAGARAAGAAERGWRVSERTGIASIFYQNSRTLAGRCFEVSWHRHAAPRSWGRSQCETMPDAVRLRLDLERLGLVGPTKVNRSRLKSACQRYCASGVNGDWVDLFADVVRLLPNAVETSTDDDFEPVDGDEQKPLPKAEEEDE